jgi:signal transduction histidine kinase
LEQHRIDLTLDVPTDMAWSCSGEHAFSVCNNLVMNAIDALSEIDRRRTLSIRAVRDDGGIRLAVRDNGLGIPTENLSRIFDAFFSTKPRTGSGLGLAVVKRVLELYGGDITVRSRLDSGTEFVIFCPEYSP